MKSIRLIALWVLGVALVATAARAEQTVTVADNFSSSGYNGSSGSAPWATPWIEQGDDGSPSGGYFQVLSHAACSGPCLWVDGGPDLQNRSVVRTADLEGATSATFTFSYRRVSSSAPQGNGKLEVAVSALGASWKPLLNISLKDVDASTQWVNVSITGWISAGTSVRFLGRVGGDTVDLVIDNVSIEAVYPGSPTTTTTSTTTTTTTIPGSSTSTTTTSTTIAPPIVTSTTTTVPASVPTTTLHPRTQDIEDVDPAPIPTRPLGPTPDLSVIPRYVEKDGLVTMFSAPTPQPVGLAHADYSLRPMTDLGATMRSAVRTLRTNLVSSGVLGAFIAYIGMRGVRDDEEDESGLA